MIDDILMDRIKAHRSVPDVYDPPTFEDMAKRIKDQHEMLEKLIAGVETVLEEWDRGAEAAFREAIEETRADVDEAKAMMPDDRIVRPKPVQEKPIGIWQTVEVNDRGLQLTARLSPETADMLGRLK